MFFGLLLLALALHLLTAILVGSSLLLPALFASTRLLCFVASVLSRQDIAALKFGSDGSWQALLLLYLRSLDLLSLFLVPYLVVNVQNPGNEAIDHISLGFG